MMFQSVCPTSSLWRLTARTLLLSCLLLPAAMPAHAELPAPATTTDSLSAAPASAAASEHDVSPEAGGVANPDEPGAQAEVVLPLADLSPWGMYQQAAAVVKAVMIGLAIASVVTWTIWLAKSLELFSAKRRINRGLQALKQARRLTEAEHTTPTNSFAHSLLRDARDELQLSAHGSSAEGIKERVSFRLERLVAASGRQMSQGTGMLATIGATAPFVGLFGTVWGIMNSFIGIATSQTTNLAVVAPGIAEALLATAMGLVAAIPAVVIYNMFARSIAGYRAQVADASAQVLLLVSRDLDQPLPEKLQAVARGHAG